MRQEYHECGCCPAKQLIPIEKQNKKARRTYHARQRGNWHGLSPVTRTVSNGKAYDRNRMKRQDRRFSD